MVRPDFPRSIIEFQRWLPDDEACRDYLISSRWSEGFRCPRCDEQVAVLLAKRLLWQCSACRYQVSLTAGTVLHGTRTPLHVWFWAAYLMSTGTPGISAVQLQRQLGIKRYETAWMMLHKLRRAMVNPERTPLTGPVEVDECFVGGLEHGLRGGRQRGTKALVVVAVEVRGAGSGRLRMQVISDASADTLCRFVQDAVAPANVHTDGWPSYRRLIKLGYQHHPRTQRPGWIAVEDLGDILPRVHRAISNLKSWLQGTHKGVSAEHLQVYLDEFVFRFNRRRTPMAAFQTLLGLGTPASAPERGVEAPATGASCGRCQLSDALASCAACSASSASGRGQMRVRRPNWTRSRAKLLPGRRNRTSTTVAFSLIFCGVSS